MKLIKWVERVSCSSSGHFEFVFLYFLSIGMVSELICSRGRVYSNLWLAANDAEVENQICAARGI